VVIQPYICTICGYLYDGESADKTIEGVPIQFQDLDPDWTCPICGVRLDLFQPTESERVSDVVSEGGEQK
jgi:rubredoxin